MVKHRATVWILCIDALHAILLDREARSTTLDLDPSHGQLREPLLRVMHLLRAMEYSSRDGRDPELNEMTQAIAQQVSEKGTLQQCGQQQGKSKGAEHFAQQQQSQQQSEVSQGTVFSKSVYKKVKEYKLREPRSHAKALQLPFS